MTLAHCTTRHARAAPLYVGGGGAYEIWIYRNTNLIENYRCTVDVFSWYYGLSSPSHSLITEYLEKFTMSTVSPPKKLSNTECCDIVCHPAPPHVVLAPKTDGKLIVTIVARNVHKAMEPTNIPIIKVRILWYRSFSKLDLGKSSCRSDFQSNHGIKTLFHAKLKSMQKTIGMMLTQGGFNMVWLIFTNYN